MSQAMMLVLAATFVLAAAGKLRRPASFAAVLVDLVGPRAARPLRVAVPGAELALAVGLLAGIAPRVMAAVALIVLAVFSCALARLRAARRPIACNCFGAIRSGDPGDGLIRNTALGALALALMLAPASGPAWSQPASQLAAAATVALGACCAWQLAGALALIPSLARR